MSEVQWIRFAPFALAGVMLLGWSLIVIIETQSGRWDRLNVALAGTGIAIATYLFSVALSFGGIYQGWPVVYFDSLRFFIGLVSFIGIPPTYMYLFRAVRTRWFPHGFRFHLRRRAMIVRKAIGAAVHKVRTAIRKEGI